MYTRIVEITTKPGKARELCNTVQEKVLPILKKQSGFVDELVLVSDNDADRVLGVSLWKNREDADHYRQEQYANVHNLIKPYLETEPVIRTFHVNSSTSHRIAAAA